MRRNNGKRGRKARNTLDLAMELRLVDDALRAPIATRVQALAWLRRWRRKPARVFWEVQPTGGQRML